MVFGGPVESVIRRFGYPIALSTSEDVELRAFSTQDFAGVLDVVEAADVVRGDEDARGRRCELGSRMAHTRGSWRHPRRDAPH
ncbi:hypothetical protein N1027_11830 [Herbiconiux sp. CPCC 205763]|uniref:Uncharacterized protein n=1 Tax=Herbiconiux aconitum TaxID=2970913 RepID=A0ABT2GRH2_9MICO|nr:hypothetical protein [Herbiconiux aconitum]MCS5718824.1 hypothetical protein [Herbiconiux aconitum]